MKFRLVSVGKKMPSWVEEGYIEYAKRLRGAVPLDLIELNPAKRTQNSSASQLMDEEAQRLLHSAGERSHIVALDERGSSWSTAQLATRMQSWFAGGQTVSLLIGGADGLAPSVRQRADEIWSLSPLTFPHPMVRVIVIEQLYRAWSLNNGHPYHRG